jgi:transcription termination/antitermination protein NusG
MQQGPLTTTRPVGFTNTAETKSQTSWCAVYCRPRFEFAVADQLQTSNIETYLPVFDSLRQWSDRRKTIKVPVFPGYVLARMADTGANRATVLRKSGVVRILGNSKGIERIPEEEIESVRRILASDRPCKGHPLIREGARVRVRHGALKGLEGLMIRARNRTQLIVSVEILGRSVSTEIDGSELEILSQNYTTIQSS